MPNRTSWSVVKAASRLAALSPQTKFAIMIGGDAVFLPLCMFIAVAFRLGSLESALDMAPVVQVGLALLTLPALGVAGLYRTVVRYIDLRVVVASSAALAAVVLVASVLAWAFQLTLLRTQGVQTIYHAAAYKHVPIVESNMQQGLRNNVFGSLAIARAALEAGAETCVLIAGFVHALLRNFASALDVTSAAPCLRHPAPQARLHGC